MANIRSNIPQGFSNQYINTFWDAEATTDVQNEYKAIFDIYNTKRAFEEDVGVTGFGYAPVKAEGAPFSYDNATQTYTTRYQNVTYALGFQISQEAKEDNTAIDMVNRFMPDLKSSMFTTVNQVAANVLNNGFTQTTLTGDGVALYSNAHPTRAGNQSNLLATAADLAYTSLQDIITQMKIAKDDRGKPAPLMGDKLIIPSQLWNTAESILRTKGAPGTGNNDTNVILSAGLFMNDYVVNHYLTSPISWFVKSDASNGFKFWNRVPVSMETVDSTISDSGDTSVRARTRFSVGVSNWRGTYASVGT